MFISKLFNLTGSVNVSSFSANKFALKVPICDAIDTCTSSHNHCVKIRSAWCNQRPHWLSNHLSAYLPYLCTKQCCQFEIGKCRTWRSRQRFARSTHFWASLSSRYTKTRCLRQSKRLVKLTRLILMRFSS